MSYTVLCGVDRRICDRRRVGWKCNVILGRSMTIDPSGVDVPTPQIKAFCDRYGVEQFAVFGSVLRADFGPDSDVDVMLKFKPGHGFTFENTPNIQDELRAMFGRPVDVIEMDRIRNPLRRSAIMNSHRVIYAA